jgi:Cof subfamily protein (haloacid dehalogenase superfamily)
MTTYKMITIDVDDTLLNDDRLVTPATKAALGAAVQHGVVVTLATGRMFASAKQIASQLNMNVPLITYQGSLVKNLLDEKVLYERTVPEDVAKFLFNYADHNNLHLQAYREDRLYAKIANDKIKQYSEVARVPYYVETDFHKLASNPLTKLLFFEDPQVLEEVERDLIKQLGSSVHITKSKPYFLEIIHKEATKGHAVKFLADYYHCDLSEVIAIGDSWNDHEMIEVAGLGVAMGNAVESLKQLADFVAPSNNEDGVKHVIERFILSTK